MTTRAYAETYLNDAMNNLGDMFDYAINDCGYAPDAFFDLFISSGVAGKFGHANPKYVAGLSGIELAIAVTGRFNDPIIPDTYSIEKTPEYWSGWALAYYQWFSGKSFEEIRNGGLTFERILSLYPTLHEADLTKFVQVAEDITLNRILPEEIMIGREPQKENDLFFVCSVIEYIGRTTKNHRGHVVLKIGKSELQRLYDLADVFHCEPIEKTASELIDRCGITEGDFDNVARCKYRVPTFFDIGKIYKRLILSVAQEENITIVNALIKVYASWIDDKIQDYNSSMYFENPGYLFESYKAGYPLE
jgi:hypothetical protein